MSDSLALNDTDLKLQFQEAFGRVASTVGVIGVRDGDDLLGMTATAISSLSNDPPSVVVMVNQQNYTARLVQAAGQFSVSFLAGGSEELAHHLSRPGQSKLIETQHLMEPESWPMPALRDATATMVCELDNCIQQFTHMILIGRITHVRVGDGPADPLLYLQREFLRLTG